MLRFLADENFSNHIVRGVLRRAPEVDIVRVQDVGLAGADDGTILQWAARRRRILLTHDVSTVAPEVGRLYRAGTTTSGVIAAGRRVPVSLAIEEILLIAACGAEGEWSDQVVYLPLR